MFNYSISLRGIPLMECHAIMVIYNKLIPFEGFKAINLFGIIFARKPLTPDDLVHEGVHTQQMKELLYIGFYLIYPVEWVVRLFVNGKKRAYHMISFEQEAYNFRGGKREHFGWLKYW